MALGLPDFNKSNLGDLFKPATTTNGVVRNMAPPNSLKMAIIPTHEPSNPLLTTLILNPESLNETKAANWVQQNIPGQSDPLMQWISGSARTVSFTAKVTLDIVENFTVSSTDNADIWSLEVEPELSRISEITEGYNSAILSQLYNVSARVNASSVTPAAIDQQNAAIQDNKRIRWKQSIQPQLDFYRGLLVPREGSRKNQLRTPPLVRLYMGDILGAANYSANQDFILASYSFNITQTTPELLPTSADVTFTFIEYNDKSKSLKPVPTPSIDRGGAKLSNDVYVLPKVIGDLARGIGNL